MRITFCLLCLAVLCPAADHLPDMRWLFERAVRIDARSDVHRYDRVRAWAMIPLLYPDNEPDTENDEVWRMVARQSLARLDASDAGYPQPRRPILLAAAPVDAMRERLGATLAVTADGQVAVHAVLDGGSGLSPGDRLVACDGASIRTPAEAGELVAAAPDQVRLALADGRELTIRTAFNRSPPLLTAVTIRSDVAPWQTERQWTLPAVDGAWLVSGSSDPGVSMVVGGQPQQPPPGDATWTTIAGPGPMACLLTRQAVDGGAGSLRAMPMRGEWRTIHLEQDGAQHRLILGVRAGQGLVIESAGPLHVLAVQGLDGQPWGDGEPAAVHRITRCGRPGAMIASAIERNGMIEVTVRLAAAPAAQAAVRLRILSTTSDGASGP